MDMDAITPIGRVPHPTTTPIRAPTKKKQSVIVKPVKLPTSTSLQITIKQVNVTGEWKWIEGRDDKCGICHAPYEGCCVDCRMPGDECPIVVGVCSHAFHMHCIVKWTNTQNVNQKAACPLCRQDWKFAH